MGVGVGLVILLAALIVGVSMKPKGDLWFSRVRLTQPQWIDKFLRQLDSGGIDSYLFIYMEDWDINAVKAICAWETGWLSDPKSKSMVNVKCNLFGIDIPNQPEVGQTFRSYYDCLAYFERMIRTSSYYVKAYPLRGDGQAFIPALSAGGYNKNQSWIDGVLWCYREILSRQPSV